MKNNFMQVGKTVACGHCDPEKYGEGLKQQEEFNPSYKCECVCHDKEDTIRQKIAKIIYSYCFRTKKVNEFGLQESLVELFEEETADIAASVIKLGDERYEKGREDERKKYENCPQCVGLRDELIKKIATIKRWVKTFRDNETGEMKDEYVVKDIDLQTELKENK